LVKNQRMQVSRRWQILWTSTFWINFLKWPCWTVITWSCSHQRFHVKPIIPTVVQDDDCGKIFLSFEKEIVI
jgi:hypothetical protein